MNLDSLSNEEQFRVTGTLTADRIERLLDLEAATGTDQIEGIMARFNEAMAQLPGEDFLDEIIDRINALAKRVRGENAEEAKSIASDLTDLSMQQTNATGYAADEYRQARKSVEQPEPPALPGHHVQPEPPKPVVGLTVESVTLADPNHPALGKTIRVKRNVWGNQSGYIGSAKVIEFGTDDFMAVDWVCTIIDTVTHVTLSDKSDVSMAQVQAHRARLAEPVRGSYVWPTLPTVRRK